MSKISRGPGDGVRLNDAIKAEIVKRDKRQKAEDGSQKSESQKPKCIFCNSINVSIEPSNKDAIHYYKCQNCGEIFQPF